MLIFYVILLYLFFIRILFYIIFIFFSLHFWLIFLHWLVVYLLPFTVFFPPGPCFFLSCPIGIEDFRTWFIDLWNNSIIPYLQEGAKDGIKVIFHASLSLLEELVMWLKPASICTYVTQLQVAISFYSELFIKSYRKAVPSNLVLHCLEYVLSSTLFPSEGTGRLGACVCCLSLASVSILSHPSVLQVHGQKAAWEDPVEWVRDTLPWPSAQQDQSKLYHLPPPSVGPHSIVSPPEERSGKDSTPNSLESDPLVCFQLANENSCY